MNKKGESANLKAKHPGNTNAQKSGVYSPRQRAEEAEKVVKELEKDPGQRLANDEMTIYADLLGFAKLLGEDLAECGVTDRKGKQRRQAGTYLRTLAACEDLRERIQARLDLEKLEDEKALPWSEKEAVQCLCVIARSSGQPPAGRIAAIKLLRDWGLSDKPYDQEFYEQLQGMSDEQLAVELEALMVPITTDPPERARDMIHDLPEPSKITDEQLRELYHVIGYQLQLD